jgi:hypothetical protein
VAPLKPEVFDVGRARLAHSQPVEPEEHRQGGVGSVEPFSGEEERAVLSAVEAPSVPRMDPGTPDVLRRVGGDAAVDVAKR